MTGSSVGSIRGPGNRPWLKPVIGLVLLVFILAIGPVLGWVTAGDRISPDLDRTAGQVDVWVDMPFEPEQFHRETLATFGVYSGRDRDDATRIRLRNVGQQDVDRIARFFWVESIEPVS